MPHAIAHNFIHKRFMQCAILGFDFHCWLHYAVISISLLVFYSLNFWWNGNDGSSEAKKNKVRHRVIASQIIVNAKNAHSLNLWPSSFIFSVFVFFPLPILWIRVMWFIGNLYEFHQSERKTRTRTEFSKHVYLSSAAYDINHWFPLNNNTTRWYAMKTNQTE